MPTCPNCGAETAPGQRFCGQCASPLGITCPACGAPAGPGQRFCGQCAAPLPATARPADAPEVAVPVAERRVCSILFADLVGFTPLAEARDPEEVRELLSEYFDTIRTVITRYGGTVEKFIGDAVMAVWGAPVAAEGDTERAVRAALDVVDAVAALGERVGATGLAARAGVVTGEVAVTVGATGEGLVAGDAVNTAARVQAAAAPGSVLADGATRRLAVAAIGFEDEGEHALKGKAAPERLWRATRVLAAVGGAQRIDGLEAPLIGRDAELRLIKELFHASADRRSPRMVVLTGVAGVGKSRLGWEFEKYVDGLAQRVFWHRGRCLSYGEGVAFWALAQAVRARLGIAETDPPDLAANKLAEGVARFVPEPGEQEFVALRLARLLGVRLPGEDPGVLAREELFAGWRVFFERLAAVQPLVVLVEDAQHADPGLLDFLDHLVDWSRDLPIFVLVLARPELTHNRAGFGVGRNRTLLALDPLDPASMDTLVDALVPGMPAAARAAITAHAQGIPLFGVETIRSLVDRDVVQPIDGAYRLVGQVGDLAVPDSLHGLLAARLDALEPAVRALAADAAVLGSSFPLDALLATSDQDDLTVRTGLSELVRREVLEVSADPLSPERGTYRFSQQLVRQVAYDTLSRRDRKARHLAVAAHLRSAFADDGEEVADVIARHYRDALHAVPDDPDAREIRAEAVAMSARAGERALRSAGNMAAAEAFAAAATLAEQGGDGRAAGWWEQAARAAVLAADYQRALDCAGRARSLREAAGDPRGVARARTIGGEALSFAGRLREAREELTAALSVLREAPDSDTVWALTELTRAESFAGSAAASASLAAETLDLAQALDVDERQLAQVFDVAAISLGFTNRIRHASALLREAARLAEKADDRFGQARALLNLSDTLAPLEPSAAEACARGAIELARQIGARALLSISVLNLAQTLLSTGDWSGAEATIEQAVQADGLDDQELLQMQRVMLAGLRGDAEQAEHFLTFASRLRATEDPQDKSMLQLAEAAAAHAQADPAAVLRHARAVVELAELIGIRAMAVLWAWPLAARAARELGDTDALSQLLAAVDAHPVGHLPRTLRAAADLVRADLAEDPATAEALRDGAITALRRIPDPYHLAWALLDRGHEPDLAEAESIAGRLQCRTLLNRAKAATPA